MLPPTLEDAVSKFGKAATARLRNPSATGEPEDQLRGPFEGLLGEMAALCGLAPDAVVTVGESSVSALHTRPDYAITVNGALASPVLRLGGDIESSGDKLAPSPVPASFVRVLSALGAHRAAQCQRVGRGQRATLPLAA